MNWDNIDAGMTPWRTRVKNLQTQLGIGASKGCFDCEHSDSCYESLSHKFSRDDIVWGDWTYVGRQYGEALIGGKKAKILFVSMDRGGGDKSKKEEFEETQNSFRASAYCRYNPHMGGVDVELKHLLDETTSREDRCQQFALTNSVRCRPITGKQKSESTSVMKQNCKFHTQAIIQELEPDIIIAQGRNQDPKIETPCQIICTLFNPDIKKKYYCKGRSPVEIGRGEEILFLLTAHPAYYSRQGAKWDKGDDLPTDELKKAFVQAREIYIQMRDNLIA